MMTLFLIFLLALSCRKEPLAIGRGEGEMCHLTVSAGAGNDDTKAVGVTDSLEKNVSCVQAFLYDEKGVLSTSGRTLDRCITVTAMPGNYTLYVLVNAPEVPLTQALAVSDLKAVRSALEDNAVGDLVGFGSREVTLFPGKSSLDVKVKHLASKVILDRITKNFPESGSLSGAVLKINGISLTNVAADCCLEGGVPSDYLNAMGYKGQAAQITHDDVGAEVDSSLEVRHTFYAYENPVERDSVGGTWCPRRSRMVIDATVDTGHCYYVVNLPVIGRNRTYEITNLVINRKGSDDQETISDMGTAVLELDVVGYNTDAYVESFGSAYSDSDIHQRKGGPRQ